MSEPIRDVNMENLFANNIDVQMMEEGNSASADIIKSLSGLHVDGSCTGTGNGDGVVFGNELVSDGAELEAAADRTDNGETLSQVVGDEYAQQNIFGRLGCMNAGGGLSAQQLFEAQDSADGTTPIFGASTQQYDLPDTLKKNTSSSTSSHTSETARRSPMNASMDSGLTVYSSIETSALQGKRLDFRKFTEDKNVSAATAKEQSAGVFVGQLPSTYTEEDTAALLRAIGDDANVPVVVRDVKSHNQSRTCAFVIVNSSALSVLLSYSKRVLCDTSCVWIVERDKASGLKEFVNSFSRDRLRGVPKAALVLEELTPQYMRGHSSASKDGKAFGRRGGEMLPVMDGTYVHGTAPPGHSQVHSMTPDGHLMTGVPPIPMSIFMQWNTLGSSSPYCTVPSGTGGSQVVGAVPNPGMYANPQQGVYVVPQPHGGMQALPFLPGQANGGVFAPHPQGAPTQVMPPTQQSEGGTTMPMSFGSFVPQMHGGSAMFVQPMPSYAMHPVMTQSPMMLAMTQIQQPHQ